MIFSSIKFSFRASKECTMINPYFSRSPIILSRISSTRRVTSEGLSPLSSLNRNCWIIYLLPLPLWVILLSRFLFTSSFTSECFPFSIFLDPGSFSVFMFINSFIRNITAKSPLPLCQQCPGHAMEGILTLHAIWFAVLCHFTKIRRKKNDQL